MLERGDLRSDSAPPLPLRIEFAIDDTVTIEGVKYSCALFRTIAFPKTRRAYTFERRGETVVVTDVGIASPYSFGQYDREVVRVSEGYPQAGENVIYPVLAMVGEAGEVAEKVKKLWRNQGKTKGASYSEEEKQAIATELGDVLWYVAAAGREIGVSLEAIALINARKVADRHARGVVKSEGDNR
jgi:NTP pyrophosphatase (non-canonical NTP hydrolase)